MRTVLVVLIGIGLLLLPSCATTAKVAPTHTLAPAQTPTPEPPTPGRTASMVYQVPGMDEVTVRDEVYRTVDGTPMVADIYYPPDMQGETRLPVVVFGFGFPDKAVIKLAGTTLREYGTNIAAARLLAASGLIAVTYDSRQVGDMDAVVAYIRQNA